MSSLGEEARIELITVVRKAILDMVNSYLNIDDVDLDMKEFGVLKKTFDALCNNCPLDNESRVYLKTLAADKIYDTLNSLMVQVGDNPKLKHDVGQILTWYQIAREV